MERSRAPDTSGRPRVDPRLLTDFDDLSGKALPSGWMHSTDAMRGGKSSVETTITRRGAGNALRIDGEIAQGFPFPWSGVMFTLGAVFMQPRSTPAASAP